MSWTTPQDLRAQVERLWNRGDLLRAAVSDALLWPVRLPLKAPSASDLADRFNEVRAWVHAMNETPYVRIERRDWKHRVQGAQQIPSTAWIDSLDAAVAFVERTRELRRFESLWRQTAALHAELLPWISKRPLKALELADHWDRLLSVVTWLKTNPRPGVYLRQIDAPGVDSKFVESHVGVLTELLDLALPAEAIDTGASGTIQFARRFGFLEKPARIRFRLLDRALPSMSGSQGLPDIALDAASFATLALPIERVFVTENETNFLAFPTVDRAIVVFGAGYGWEALARASWLHQCQVHYWGDIDTHGFAILDRLRAHLPHAASFLMDRLTLLEHRTLWGEEPEPVRHDLPRLTADETAVYDQLRFDRLQPRLRLEQERIGIGWVINVVSRIGSRQIRPETPSSPHPQGD